MHVAADPVADERAHDRQALRLDVRLDRVGDVAEPVAGRHCSTAANSDSSVTASSFCATGEIGPTGKVRAASATQPSRITPMSTDRMSPRLSL